MRSQQDDEEEAEMLRWLRLHQEDAAIGPQAQATTGTIEHSRLAFKMQVHKDHKRYGSTGKTLIYFARPSGANKQEPQRTRRKQRTRLKLVADEAIRCKSQAPPSRRGRKSVMCWPLPPAVAFSLFMLSNGFGVGLMMPTSAQEFSQQQQEPLAQPLIYNMLHEPGSGSGGLGLASFARTSSSLSSPSSGSSGSQDQTYASTSATDVSPSLIEARCWNNYENDNDCKQLNVITAPEGERQRHQNQHDDNIITPVVIFEASSTVEPAEGYDEISKPDLRPVFMAPPYQSSGGSNNDKADSLPPKRIHQIAKSNNNEGGNFYAQSTATTSSPEADGDPVAPITRPSVFHFVATPQPPKTTTSITSKRPKTKTTTTTLGRRCRDENDADCDEPEENPVQQPNYSAPSDADEKDDSEDDDAGENDDQMAANGGSSTSSMPNSAIEIGSGGGLSSPTDDDNDDSTDDGDDGESSGSNSIQEQNASNPGGDEFARPTEGGRLLVVTSIYPNKQPSATSAPDSDLTSARATTSTAAPTTRRPQNGAAEIEVVVHSTLPPSFPLGHRDHHKTSSTSESSQSLDETFVGSTSQTDLSATTTTTTSTTPMPDDTVTSKPIFPSSTMQSQPVNQPDESEGGEAATAQQGPTETTTEVDLYTFRPIPIPVEQPLEPRPSNVVAASSSEQQDNNSNNKQQATPVKQEVSSQHIHHDHSQASGYRNSFDGWTTRKPSSYLLGTNKDQQQSGQLPDVILGLNSIRGPGGAKGGAHGHLGTDMLPTMLLYASVIILLFISLIFVIVAYGFWRRNNLRRQTLLAKAQMLNGAVGALPGNMIESMSHASHLMHGGGMAPPQGLLSTYAPGKGLTMGKVTTSLAKPPGQAGMMLGEDEEDPDQQQQVFKSNSKDQLVEGNDGEVEDGEQESLLDDQNQHQHQHSSTRNSRPANSITNRQLQNQSGSWSTDQDPTTTSSGSQRTQDSQHQLNQQQMQQSSNQRHHYPNSLSDGRQNSSSISDSQCSPDPGPSGASNSNHHLQQQQPILGPSAQNHQAGPSPLQHHELNMIPNASPQRQFEPQQQRPMYRPAGPNGGAMPLQQPMGQIAMQPPDPHGLRQPFYPMMVQNGNLMKQRLITSRSIEDIQPSQHVGFVESNNNSQHVPYLPQQPQQQPQILPQLVQARPHYQQYQQQQHLAGTSQMHNSMISPQRIAMNPLATLGRRYPPGAMLNRNIYSEDSSSFMTTSPSLARTSSSSSFAFNMSNLPTPSSIKAKPMLDASGRLINDYTANFNGTPVGGVESNGNRTNSGPPPPGAPPVFGRSDRSEAWYV